MSTPLSLPSPTPAELATLEQTFAQANAATREGRTIQRHTSIILSLAHGKDASKVAQEHNVTLTTVLHVARRYSREGITGLTYARKPYPRHVYTEDAIDAMRALLATDPQDYGARQWTPRSLYRAWKGAPIHRKAPGGYVYYRILAPHVFAATNKV